MIQKNISNFKHINTIKQNIEIEELENEMEKSQFMEKSFIEMDEEDILNED